MPNALHATQVIQRPVITEKSTWDVNDQNRYAFKVDLKASKPQIKAAIESLYKVRVTAVNTQRKKGKAFRNRFGYGVTSDWKKAVVTLHPDDKIDTF